jgi:hypothetical protein
MAVQIGVKCNGCGAAKGSIETSALTRTNEDVSLKRGHLLGIENHLFSAEVFV